MKKIGVTLSPELWDELAPFSLIFNSKGQVVHMAERLLEAVSYTHLTLPTKA